MKTNTVLAIMLIAIGILALTYQSITYTTKEQVIDLGFLQMTAEKQKTFPLLPIVGIVTLVGGIVLLVRSRKNS